VPPHAIVGTEILGSMTAAPLSALATAGQETAGYAASRVTSSCADDIRDDKYANQMTSSPVPLQLRVPIPLEPISGVRVNVKKALKTGFL
jgi:hypothetical protein